MRAKSQIEQSFFFDEKDDRLEKIRSNVLLWKEYKTQLFYFTVLLLSIQIIFALYTGLLFYLNSNLIDYGTEGGSFCENSIGFSFNFIILAYFSIILAFILGTINGCKLILFLSMIFMLISYTFLSTALTNKSGEIGTDPSTSKVGNYCFLLYLAQCFATIGGTCCIIMGCYFSTYFGSKFVKRFSFINFGTIFLIGKLMSSTLTQLFNKDINNITNATIKVGQYWLFFFFVGFYMIVIFYWITFQNKEVDRLSKIDSQYSLRIDYKITFDTYGRFFKGKNVFWAGSFIFGMYPYVELQTNKKFLLEYNWPILVGIIISTVIIFVVIAIWYDIHSNIYFDIFMGSFILIPIFLILVFFSQNCWLQTILYSIMAAICTGNTITSTIQIFAGMQTVSSCLFICNSIYTISLLVSYMFSYLLVFPNRNSHGQNCINKTCDPCNNNPTSPGCTQCESSFIILTLYFALYFIFSAIVSLPYILSIISRVKAKHMRKQSEALISNSSH